MKDDAHPPRLSITGLKKSFGNTVALSDVSLSASSAEVHGVIGVNGAGKSTLMKVLAGAVSPDAGTLLLDGAPYAPRSPGNARERGVAMVHQELALCPHLTVADNVVLGAEPLRFGLRDRSATLRDVRSALAQVTGDEKLRIDPDAKVGDLSIGDRQLVEIARALAMRPRCKVLVLDEPTSSLPAGDVERLFGIVRRLKSEGVTVLYISHFLEEIRAICDRCTVLRDGRTVFAGEVARTSDAAIVEHMAGRSIAQSYPRSPRAPGEEVLTVTDLAGMEKPAKASFALRRGEVLGIAGLIGAGRTELLRAVFGLDRARVGEVKVAGAGSSRADPEARLAQGVGMLSEDRKGEGLATSLSIADNVTLSDRRGVFVSPARSEASAARWIGELAIRASGPAQSVSELSGGNQQKVAIARLLHRDVDVLLLDEPTRGIDVASKAQVYALIDALAAKGKAVLVVSSYLPELLGVCDRIAVMCKGELGPARPVSEWTEHSLLAAASGAREG